MTLQGPVLSPKVHSLCPKLCFHTDQKTHSRDQSSSRKCSVVSPQHQGLMGYGRYQHFSMHSVSWLFFPFLPATSPQPPPNKTRWRLPSYTSPFSALPGLGGVQDFTDPAASPEEHQGHKAGPQPSFKPFSCKKVEVTNPIWSGSCVD